MDFKNSLVLGVALLEAVLLAFMWFGDRMGDVTRMFSVGLVVLAVFVVVRYVFQFRKFEDLYRIGREVIPAFENKYYQPVDFSKVRSEIYRGYYLYNYWLDNITVAWFKGVGPVSRQFKGIEDFKKGFNPEDVAVPVPLVDVEGKGVGVKSGGGSEDVE